MKSILTLEQRVNQLEKSLLRNYESVDEDFQRRFSAMRMEEAWKIVADAIKSKDIELLNACANVGRSDFDLSWFVKELIKTNADYKVTRATCKVLMPIIEKGEKAELWDDALKLLNNTSNEYLINFLIENGYAGSIVGGGRRLSPLIKQVLDDNGISYTNVRSQNRREPIEDQLESCVKRLLKYIKADAADTNSGSIKDICYIIKNKPEAINDYRVKDAMLKYDNYTTDLINFEARYADVKEEDDLYEM